MAGYCFECQCCPCHCLIKTLKEGTYDYPWYWEMVANWLYNEQGQHELRNTHHTGSISRSSVPLHTLYSWETSGERMYVDAETLSMMNW